jgi:hypothetical protein
LRDSLWATEGLTTPPPLPPPLPPSTGAGNNGDDTN